MKCFCSILTLANSFSNLEGIKESAAPWGLICLRYEIRTMTMPPEIQRAMKVIMLFGKMSDCKLPIY